MQLYLREIYSHTLDNLDSEELTSDFLTTQVRTGWDVLSVGKAAVPMARGAIKIWGEGIERGFLLTKTQHLSSQDRKLLSPKFQLREASHPIPDEVGLQATQELQEWLTRGQSRGLLVLLSGGASSLLVAPAPPLNLSDLRELNEALMASALPIEIINVLRKHVSLVKGGQLARLCLEHYDSVEQALMVDICAPTLPSEDVLSLVGSGPFLTDHSSLREARAILEGLRALLSEETFRKAQAALLETPEFVDVKTTVLASYLDVRRVARDRLQDSYLEPQGWSTVVADEVQELAKKFARTVQKIQAEGGRGVLVACGEPTVELKGQPGMGGRCQELALHFAKLIEGNSGLTLLAGSTDGTDGPSPYAGAVVDGSTWPELCRLLGRDTVEKALSRHQSSNLLQNLPESHLKTGPTGQNLNDLFLLGIGEKGAGPHSC